MFKWKDGLNDFSTVRDRMSSHDLDIHVQQSEEEKGFRKGL